MEITRRKIFGRLFTVPSYLCHKFTRIILSQSTFWTTSLERLIPLSLFHWWIDEIYKNQRHFQGCTIYNPAEKSIFLQDNQCLNDKFFDLAGRILTYLPKWEYSRIKANMICIFSSTRPAQEAMNKFRNIIKRELCSDEMDHQINLSTDLHRSCINSSDEFHMATEQSIKVLNKELKEPCKLD